MKAKGYNGQKVRYVTEKLDGHRYTVLRDSKDIQVLSRSKDVDIWPKLRMNHPWWATRILDLPKGTILHCELYAPGRFATSVPTLINEMESDLEVSVFAAPKIDGYDTTTLTLQSLHRVMNSFGFDTPDIYATYGTPREIDKTFWQQFAVERRIEGVVAKLGHFEGWYKIKPVKELDAIVTRWERGTGKNWDRLGGLHLALMHDGEMVDIGRVGTGFSDEQRDEITKADVGRVVQVQYDSVAAGGKLKFPRFIRFRDDKSAAECTQEQLT